MPLDILANLKAGASAAVTALTDAEMAAKGSEDIRSLNPILDSLLQPDLVAHSSAPQIHQKVSTTVLHFRRNMDGQLQKAKQELKMIDPSSKEEARKLKEEIVALEAFIVFLKEISTKNLDSSGKIKDLEKTLESIIAFNESYAVSKAGGYIGHYAVLLAGLVGIPALAVTLAIPATQILGGKIAKKYYEHQKDKAEQKGGRIIEDSKLNLQKIALEFLELKTNPYNKNNSPEQAAYLDALKKAIGLETDINRNLAAIHDYVILKEVYLKPDAKLANVNQRLTFVVDKIKSLQAELKEPRYIIFNDRSSHFSSSNSADALKRELIIAQIALLQAERSILRPIVQNLHKPGKSAETETKSMTDQRQERQVELSSRIKKDQDTIRPLIDNGINMSNIIKASKNGYDLGGIVSPGAGESSGIVSRFDNDPDSSDDEGMRKHVSAGRSDKPDLNPRDLLKLPIETGDDEDEKSSRTPEPTSHKISAPSISKDTLQIIIAELDKYSGKRSNSSFLKMRSSDEVIKKTRSADTCKLICLGEIPGVHSHQQVLIALGVEKEKYIAQHARSPKSSFVKLVTKIEELVKQDQTAQALEQVSLTRS